MTGIGDTKLDVLGQGDINVSIEVDDTVIHSVMKDVLFIPGLGKLFLAQHKSLFIFRSFN